MPYKLVSSAAAPKIRLGFFKFFRLQQHQHYLGASACASVHTVSHTASYREKMLTAAVIRWARNACCIHSKSEENKTGTVLHPTETRAFLQHKVNNPESTAGKTDLDALFNYERPWLQVTYNFKPLSMWALIPFSHFFLVNLRTRSFPDSFSAGQIMNTLVSS